VYLPTKRLPAYNGMVAAIDWWQYEDAWHILVSD
jgi:hypothetical protein